MKIIMQLGTLTCPSCMTKIEKAVANHDGVENVKVLFNASKVKANFDPVSYTHLTLPTKA